MLIIRVFILNIFFVVMFTGLAFGRKLSQVELQWSVCEKSEQAVFDKLKVNPDKHVTRDVYYSDTLQLDAFERGAYIRTRVSKNKIKTMVKIKNFEEKKIPWDFFADKDYKCEIDSYIQSENIGCSLYYEPKSIKNLISTDQMDYLMNEAQFSDFSYLQLLGPAKGNEWKWDDEYIGEEITLESIRSSKNLSKSWSWRNFDSKNVDKCLGSNLSRSGCG